MKVKTVKNRRVEVRVVIQVQDIKEGVEKSVVVDAGTIRTIEDILDMLEGAIREECFAFSKRVKFPPVNGKNPS